MDIINKMNQLLVQKNISSSNNNKVYSTIIKAEI